jgi:hypothetical protein
MGHPASLLYEVPAEAGCLPQSRGDPNPWACCCWGLAQLCLHEAERLRICGSCELNGLGPHWLQDLEVQ